MLLAAILNAHPQLHGVLADLPHVLERAQQREFLGGELEVANRDSSLAISSGRCLPAVKLT